MTANQAAHEAAPFSKWPSTKNDAMTSLHNLKGPGRVEDGLTFGVVRGYVR
jgi:hypothetical protein